MVWWCLGVFFVVVHVGVLVFVLFIFAFNSKYEGFH